MSADDPFTPHADSIQTAWVLMCQQSRISTQPPVEELEAEFDRFLARVRRDAAREALDGLMVHAETREALALTGREQIKWRHVRLTARNYGRAHYPEETP